MQKVRFCLASTSFSDIIIGGMPSAKAFERKGIRIIVIGQGKPYTVAPPRPRWYQTSELQPKLRTTQYKNI